MFCNMLEVCFFSLSSNGVCIGQCELEQQVSRIEYKYLVKVGGADSYESLASYYGYVTNRVLLIDGN